MKVTLKEIANIQTGIFAKPEAEGEIVYLQSKYFDENGKLNSILHPDLKQGKVTEKHMLRDGDVLFAAKGTKNFATWYEAKNQPAGMGALILGFGYQWLHIFAQFLSFGNGCKYPFANDKRRGHVGKHSMTVTGGSA